MGQITKRRYKEENIRDRGKSIFYYLECPIEKMRERVISRSKNPPEDSFEISEGMFDEYLKYWEPPTEEEGVLLVI